LSAIGRLVQEALPFDAVPVGPDPPGGPRAATPFELRVSPPRRPPIADALLFVRHPRARRYVLRVLADGTVRVTIPRWGSRREGAAFAAEQSSWIEKHRRRVEEDRHRLSPSPLAPEVERELRARAKRELPQRLLQLAERHSLAVSRVSVRDQRARWGSCSRAGHISLNWRLVLMPDAVRDYVMIHELMHLRKLDHSPAFWALVNAACPDVESSRAWLRSWGSSRKPADPPVQG
jgi:hypothetical protein